jgi:hypothetical protein
MKIHSFTGKEAFADDKTAAQAPPRLIAHAWLPTAGGDSPNAAARGTDE